MMKWDEARIRQLKSLVDEGLNGSEIGDLMGVSRNSIIGKCHRLRFVLRGNEKRQRSYEQTRKPARRRPQIRPKLVKKFEIKYEKKPLSEVFSGKGVPIVDLEYHHCRWPKEEITYCGKRRMTGSSYCPEHEWLSKWRPRNDQSTGDKFFRANQFRSIRAVSSVSSRRRVAGD